MSSKCFYLSFYRFDVIRMLKCDFNNFIMLLKFLKCHFHRLIMPLKCLNCHFQRLIMLLKCLKCHFHRLIMPLKCLNGHFQRLIMPIKCLKLSLLLWHTIVKMPFSPVHDVITFFIMSFLALNHQKSAQNVTFIMLM